MPIFQLYTNVSGSKITPDFIKSTVKVVADTLGKPTHVSIRSWILAYNQVFIIVGFFTVKTFFFLFSGSPWNLRIQANHSLFFLFIQRVVVHVQSDQKIFAGDTEELTGIVTLRSIGAMGKEENKKHSIAICGHLDKTLGIPPNR